MGSEMCIRDSMDTSPAVGTPVQAGLDPTPADQVGSALPGIVNDIRRALTEMDMFRGQYPSAEELGAGPRPGAGMQTGEVATTVLPGGHNFPQIAGPTSGAGDSNGGRTPPSETVSDDNNDGIITPDERKQHGSKEEEQRKCPPGYFWNGVACVRESA